MTKRNFPLFPAVVVAVTLASVGSGAAQDKRVPLCSDDANGTCNGISVGRPKVFDNHTLSLMIDGLTQTLTKMQSFMDQKSVAGAIANTQGSSQTDTTTSVNLTVNPGGTPAAPTLDAAATPPSFNPGYGQSASDLLTDQVNLTYQLFNLQMILDRALSDRLCKEEETCPQRKEQDNRTRLQAVLGFNVTIDPPRAATDAAAVVEITLSSKTGPLSLVTMMPQEKTYNASAFSSKSNAFGGAAAAGTVQVGGSARKKSQIFYLYRDNDTLSYERMTADAKTVVFGWMFRPVLGRRSVSPGLRQLFAVLALPSQDCAASAGAKVAECTATISSKMRTYWKQYDRKTLTSFERRDANRASEFLYGVSMGMAKPQIFSDPRYLYAQPVADDIDVPSTSDYQSGLQPKVNAVTWRPAGNKNIIVSARGMNFFYGTKVLLGDKAYSESPAAGESAGLTLKSDQAFDLMTTLDALVAGPGIVLGRYDNSVPLTNPANQFHFRDEARGSGDEQPTGFLNGFEMANVVLTPSITGLRKIQVYLRRKLCAGKPDAADAYCLTEAKNESTLEAEVRDALAKVSAADKLLQNLQKATQELRAATAAKSQKGIQTAKEELAAAEQALNATEAEKKNTLVLLERADKDVEDRERELGNAEAKRNAHNRAIRDLQVSDLPVENLSGRTTLESLVLSIDGAALELPYFFFDFEDPIAGVHEVLVEANVKDSQIAAGGGTVKVTFPFYPQDRWSATYQMHDGSQSFEVMRVSESSIIVRRIDGTNFTNALENDPDPANKTGYCWWLYAGDTRTHLVTPNCMADPDAIKPPPPKNVTAPVAPAAPAVPATASAGGAGGKAGAAAKPTPASKQPAKTTAGKTTPDPGAPCDSKTEALPPPSDYTVTAFNCKFPDKVILVAPNGAMYPLVIPAAAGAGSAAKPSAAKAPVALKQYDAPWLTIAAKEITPVADSTLEDLSAVTAVQANGKKLVAVLVTPKPAAAGAGAAKSPPKATSIEVEITQELTAKPGAVDIGFQDAKGNLLGTRTLQIAATETTTKGASQ